MRMAHCVVGLVLCVLCVSGCPAEEQAAAGTGAGQGAAGAAGMMLPATGGVGGASGMAITGGTGGVAGVMAMSGGVGGTAGEPTAGAMSTPDAGMTTDAMTTLPPGHPDCAPGYDCRNPTGQFICVDATSSLPLACTMGGTECAAIPGSTCAAAPTGMGMQCLKTCGETAAMGCPMGTTCMDPFGLGAFCAMEGGALPPSCTMGGTECMPYGLACIDVMGILGCWMNCTL